MARSQGAKEFSELGYAVNRLESAGNGKFVCAEEISCGTPLLALPLDDCWTKKAVVSACPRVAMILQACAEEAPSSAIFEADATWISLHMIDEIHKRGARHQQIEILLEVGDVNACPPLLSWGDDDIASLQGSRWKEKVEKRRMQLVENFEVITSRLGKRLEFSQSEYFWAQHIIDQFGIHFMGADGLPFLVVVPGLNMIKVDDSTTSAFTGGARIELAAERPAFVLYAERSYTTKEEYKLSHGGLACSSGCCLMSCGKSLSNCQYESVELEATLIVDRMPQQRHAVASVLEGIAALFTDSSPPKPAPGECLARDILDDVSPVRLDNQRANPRLSFTVRFSSTCLVPGARALTVLGTVLTYDSSNQAELSSKESEVTDIFGVSQCQRRALEFLRDLANEALARYSASATSDALGFSVVAAEKKLLTSTLTEIDRLLGHCGPEGIESTVAVNNVSDVINELKDGHASPSFSLSRVIKMLRAHRTLCEEVATVFKTNPNRQQGDSLLFELDVLRSCMKRCPLGDPSEFQRLPVLDSTDEASQAFREAAVSLLNAATEACKWEHMACPAPMDATTRKSAAAALVKVAAHQMKLFDFEGALGNLRQSMALITNPNAMKLAIECAVARAASGAMTTDTDWAVYKSMLALLKQKLHGVGYTKPGLHWSYPSRFPPTVKFCDQSELPSGDLLDTLKLFMMHNVVAMGRVTELLGKKVTTMLLESGLLSCYSVVNAEILMPAEAVKLVSKKPELPLSVFSNIMLWPLEEDLLVAFDFDQLTLDRENFDPVPCLTQDAYTLTYGAPRTKAANVLDVQCGSGAQGLIALKYYADKVVFLDSSQRSLRFTRFSVHLNAFEGRASFINGNLESGLARHLKQERFDVILSCLSCFPEPASIIVNGGSTLSGSGSDGLKVLGIVAKDSVGLLKNGGRFIATCTLPNVDSFISRLQSWLENAGANTVILRGERTTVSKFANLATAGSPLASSIAFLNGLKAEGVESMSQSVVMIQKLAEVGRTGVIDLRDEHIGLWSDPGYVASELQASLDQQHLLDTNVRDSNDVQVYDMDWNDGDDEIISADGQGAVVSSAKEHIDSCWSTLIESKGHHGRLASLIQPSREKDYTFSFPIGDGATWQNAALTQVLGFPLPCLVDQLWRKVEIPLGTHFPPNANAPEGLMRIPPTSFRMASVELEGCAAFPEMAKEALHSMDCFDMLTYESSGLSENGEPLPKILRKKLFGGWRKKLKDDEMPPNMLERYDTFVLAFGERGGGKEEWVLPEAMRQFLTYISSYVETHNVAKRVVVLTCGATGPTFPDGVMQDMVHSAAPLRGLLRCARIEVPELPILAIDTDQMGAKGDVEVLADQILRELEAYTPIEGLQDCTPEKFSEAVYRTHREVSWRRGERYFPGWVVSARNPIHLQSNVDHCKMPADEVAFITGGTGGLGVVTAEAMVECGLRCVILSSRGGKLYEGQGLEERVAKMQAQGAKIILDKCDTTSEESVKDALSRARKHGKLKHILHAAGVFRYEVKEAFAPKVKSAWWLHKHTLEDKLDTFVCYASMTEFIGTANMSAYAQANTYMEELCRQRHAMGLSGTSIEFPEVIGAGMAQAQRGESDLWDSAAIGVDHVKQALKQVIAGTAPIGPVIGILTFGFLAPRPPISFIQHAPLYARRHPSWANIPNLEGMLGPQMMKQLKGLMKQIDTYLPSLDVR